MENLIDFEMSLPQKQAIKDSIEGIKTNTPWRKVLTSEERKAGMHLGTNSFDFIEKANDYMDQNPHLVASYIDVTAFKHDVQATRDLSEILRLLAPLTQSLEDTASLAGMEAMAAALAFYNSLKVAAKNNVPGAEVAYNDLKQRFTNTSRKTEPALDVSK